MKTNLKSTKVLIISQYFPPDISGGGTRAYNYAKCLAQRGFDVTVITAHPHLHAKKPREYQFKLIKKEKQHNFQVIRVWVPSLLHTSILNRILLHSCFIFTSLFPIFSLKPDVIFASEPNLFSIIPAYLYSKIRKGKIIRVVDDMWPEVIYERGLVRSGILKKILDWLARFSYSKSKYILPLTQEAKDHIMTNYSIDEKKIKVIEHGVDSNIFYKIDKINKKDFVVMYSGALVESYDFDLIITAAKELKNEKIKFVIRGKGNQYNHLQRKIKELKLENITMNNTLVSEEKLSEQLNQANIFVVPLKNEKSLNLSLPTKILEYQSIGKPIICCSNGAPGNYVERTKSGIRIDCGDVKKFYESIQKLYDEPKLCQELGNNGLNYVKNNLTFKKIGERLEQLIVSLNKIQ